MAVRVIRDERIYHSPTSQFHDLRVGQIIEGDFANYLEQNAPSVVEPVGIPAVVGENGPGVPAGEGVGTDAVLTPDAFLAPVSIENMLTRAGAATFSPHTSLPPGTPDPVQLAQDGRSGMAVTVPVTVTVDSAAASIPGAGNPVEARTQVEGRPQAGSNIVSENGSPDGAGVVVIPKEAYESVLVEPVTGATVSQAAPLVEGAATSATAVDGERPSGERSARTEVDESIPAPDAASNYDPSAHTGPEVIRFASDNPAQRQAILKAERAGKARTTVLGALSS